MSSLINNDMQRFLRRRSLAHELGHAIAVSEFIGLEHLYSLRIDPPNGGYLQWLETAAVSASHKVAIAVAGPMCEIMLFGMPPTYDALKRWHSDIVIIKANAFELVSHPIYSLTEVIGILTQIYRNDPEGRLPIEFVTVEVLLKQNRSNLVRLLEDLFNRKQVNTTELQQLLQRN